MYTSGPSTTTYKFSCNKLYTGEFCFLVSVMVILLITLETVLQSTQRRFYVFDFAIADNRGGQLAKGRVNRPLALRETDSRGQSRWSVVVDYRMVAYIRRTLSP